MDEFDKYLILEFSNAKLFNNKVNRKYKQDFVLEARCDTGRKKREKIFFSHPITNNQINNVLQVLIGERPSPALRKVYFENDKYLNGLSSKSLIKYYNVDYFEYKDKKEPVKHKELIQTSKPAHDATGSSMSIYYHKMKKYLDDEKSYNLLKKLLLKKFSEHNTFDELKNNISLLAAFKEIKKDFISNNVKNKKETEEFIKACKENKKTPIERYFDKSYDEDKLSQSLNGNKLTKLNVNKGVSFCVENYRGKIYVPINNYYIEKIKKGKGCATLLDGGLVKIRGIKKKRDLNLNDLIEVEKLNNEICVSE